MWIAPDPVNCCHASPSVGYNNGPAFDDGNVAQAANQLILVAPPAANQTSYATDLIFTAPVSGTYSLTSTFFGDQRFIDVGVDVLVNGSAVFTSNVTFFGDVVPFDTTLTLAAGDTVPFAVQQGSGNQNTGRDASLTVVTPLPAALPLFATGLGGLGLVGWRRKRKAQAI